MLGSIQAQLLMHLSIIMEEHLLHMIKTLIYGKQITVLLDLKGVGGMIGKYILYSCDYLRFEYHINVNSSFKRVRIIRLMKK